MQPEATLTAATALHGAAASRSERITAAASAAAARLPRPSDEECARIASVIRGAGSLEARQPHQAKYDLAA